MSTNFYATINITADDDLTRELKLHLGKTGTGTIVDGNLFPSLDAMVLFLKGAEANTVITDEYGSVHTVKEFADRFYNYGPLKRAKQYNDIADNHPEYLHQYDLDSEGFTIAKGVWF